LSALSSMAQENAVYVVDAIDLSEPSTKSMAALFEKIGAEKPLVVTDERSEVVEKSTRNIPGAMALHVEGLNVYDIVNHTALVLTRDAVSRAEEAFA